MNVLLGKFGVYKHSGFSGTITGFCAYIGGYEAVEITPKTTNKNEYRSSQWFARSDVITKE